MERTLSEAGVLGDVPAHNINTNQNAVYAAARFNLTDPLNYIAGARYSMVEGRFVLCCYDTPVDSKYHNEK